MGYWDPGEGYFGATVISSKRPYGNSYVARDIAEILGAPDEDWEYEDGEKAIVTEEAEERFKRLHVETMVALQIVLAAGEFRPGRSLRLLSGVSAEKQPCVRRLLRLPRDRSLLLLASVSCQLSAKASPEAGRARVVLLKWDHPFPRVQVHNLGGCLVADALPACPPDHEEIAHDSGFSSKSADERKATRSLAAVNEVPAAVRVLEILHEPGPVQPVAVGHVSPELRQVVHVQRPQPLSDPALLARGDQLKRRR